ncbi:MAG: response regulator transcription factor [Hyalangium sp.]|uniref:response regulator transcription factor n=1 Tax=Hyalangium sp. TaxID=2028555 RepID=UPI00389B1BB8
MTCSEGAMELLDEWFPPHERGDNGLPKEWQERLLKLEQLEQLEEDKKQEQFSWKRTGASQGLRVNFVPLPPGQEPHRSWVLLLEKVSFGLTMPLVWRKVLTHREAEVVECALQYMDNKEIGEQLKCTEATVKKHLQRAFEKLGVETRNMLFYWASRR